MNYEEPELKKRKYQCDVCEYTTGSRSALWNHKNAKHVYNCDMCEFEGSQSDVNKHKRTEHVEEAKEVETKRYQCDQCKNSYSKISALKNHKLHFHDGVKLNCDLCEYEGSKNGLIHHKKSVHDRKFQCDACPKTYPHPYALKEHKLFVHEGLRLTCDLCDFQGTKESLKHHKNSVHEQKFKCDQCEYNGTRLNYLRDHIESKHMGIRHDCHQCDATFAIKGNLKTHIKEIHGDENQGEAATLLCDQCEFTTNKKAKLKGHIEAVHLKKFSCPKCEMVCTTNAGLKEHILRKHDNTGQALFISKKNRTKYMCDKCPFKTHWQGFLREHMENKHGSKVFACDLCDYTTTFPKEFNKHWGYRHDPSTKRYPCDQCHYSATFVQALKSHIQMVHEKIRYPCDMCDHQASKQADLLKHKKHVHEKVRVSCDYCELTYADPGGLRYHVQLKHPDQYIKYARSKKQC